MRSFLLLIVAGCATAVEEGPLVDPVPLEEVFGPEGDAVASPRTALTLIALSPLAPGQTSDLQVTGLNPGESVTIAYSMNGTGAGPCLGMLGGQCLDIVGPINLLGSAVADASGVAVYPVSIPSSASSGLTLHLQAIAKRGVGGNLTVLSQAISETVTDQVTDDFVHFPAAVDVLFVIDDSCSMYDEQTALASSFQPMIDTILDLGLDYHVGVVSTDMNRASKSGKLQPSLSGATWIDPSDPNPVLSFTQMASLGTSGSATEQGLAAMSEALTTHATTFNLGFRRATAQLAVVVLSDEEDQSPGSASPYADTLLAQTLYTGDASFSSIVEPLGGCPTGSSIGLRYLAVTNQVGGESASICLADYSPVLESVAEGLFTSVPYSLSQVPDPATIEITADEAAGPVVLLPTDWVYDAADNTVRFTSAYHPLAGTDLHVTYEVP